MLFKKIIIFSLCGEEFAAIGIDYPPGEVMRTTTVKDDPKDAFV